MGIVVIIFNIILLFLSLFLKKEILHQSVNLTKILTIALGSFIIVTSYLEASWVYNIFKGYGDKIKKSISLIKKHLELGWDFAVIVVVFSVINGFIYDTLSGGAFFSHQDQKTLLMYLRSTDRWIAKEGIRESINIKSQLVTQELIKIAGKKNDESALAAWALGVRRDKLGEKVLFDLLTKGTNIQKRASTIALSRIRYPDFDVILGKLVLENIGPVKDHIMAFGIAKLKRNEQLLISIISGDIQYSQDINGIAIWSLGQIESNESCENLEKILSSQPSLTSCLAAQSIVNIGCSVDYIKLKQLYDSVDNYSLCNRYTYDDFYNPPIVLIPSQLYKSLLVKIFAINSAKNQQILSNLTRNQYELPLIRSIASGYIKKLN